MHDFGAIFSYFTEKRWNMWWQMCRRQDQDGLARLVSNLAYDLGGRTPSEPSTKLWLSVTLLGTIGADRARMLAPTVFANHHTALKRQFNVLRGKDKADSDCPPVICRLNLFVLDSINRAFSCRGMGIKCTLPPLLVDPNAALGAGMLQCGRAQAGMAHAVDEQMPSQQLIANALLDMGQMMAILVRNQGRPALEDVPMGLQ